VARDLFLDGTWISHSASVRRRVALGEATLGIGVRVSRLILEWTVHARTRAYDTQPTGHTYSSLTAMIL
jgi:hypothetical protein